MKRGAEVSDSACSRERSAWPVAAVTRTAQYPTSAIAPTMAAGSSDSQSRSCGAESAKARGGSHGHVCHNEMRATPRSAVAM